MLRFVLNRLGLLIPTFIGVSIISFTFIRVLPGDPILLLAGERGVTPERYAQLKVLLGFDRPLPQNQMLFRPLMPRGCVKNDSEERFEIVTLPRLLSLPS